MRAQATQGGTQRALTLHQTADSMWYLRQAHYTTLIFEDSQAGCLCWGHRPPATALC